MIPTPYLGSNSDMDTLIHDSIDIMFTFRVGKQDTNTSMWNYKSNQNWQFLKFQKAFDAQTNIRTKGKEAVCVNEYYTIQCGYGYYSITHYDDFERTLKVMAKLRITIPKPEPFLRLAGPLARVPSGEGQGVPQQFVWQNQAKIMQWTYPLWMILAHGLLQVQALWLYWSIHKTV